MIKIKNLDKSFDGFKALTDLNLNVKKGSIYGLVGTNGAGKTTLIKHLTGILKPDAGDILIEDSPVFDNITIKERMGFIPDDLYFFASYNLKESAKFYSSIYPNWNQKRYEYMVKQFDLNEKRKLSKFSKGMQKQAAFILTMSSMPDYLILDEPIDGLDPIIRKLVWKYIVEDVAEREMTVLVSSHNLRELEGICDSIGILSKGKMMIERDLDELKSDIHKIQVAFKNAAGNPYEGLNVLHKESRGTVDLLIIRNRKDVVEQIINEQHPVIFDVLPLSLEEIFIYELGGGDHEIESILF
ncbi:ABC transporter ATP-binding protein [Sinanaerobacter chloroacetimidivorans]|jgi:ABC-2 type transport system ATP-binding protein|uniref:ABC transporter ATP-binding protein n=1 Tax=Sinanaerobacter chloroacetimidivorans TaxID=2818044 RepID=A0A8J7VZE3_9FIRM|nr:ABC transporter ATP-binding protein [Sinanaerobacter chloroacetimidivorans]MBR0596803.1 ABC transporter ATP-binding protein [Sinanaerobacter chloroacetimidivorans]